MKRCPSTVLAVIATMLLASTVTVPQELPKITEYFGMCDGNRSPR